MSEPVARFSCEACGKSYKWKFELAGRKVKCSCGHVMRAPDEPPSPEDEAPLIPLADEASRDAQRPAPPRRPAPVEHEALHSVAGHQVLAGTTFGAPAVVTEPDPPPPPKPVKPRPSAHHPGAGDHPPGARHKTVHVNAGQVLGSHLRHETEPKPRPTKVIAMVGVLVAILAVLVYLMVR